MDVMKAIPNDVLRYFAASLKATSFYHLTLLERQLSRVYLGIHQGMIKALSVYCESDYCEISEYTPDGNVTKIIAYYANSDYTQMVRRMKGVDKHGATEYFNHDGSFYSFYEYKSDVKHGYNVYYEPSHASGGYSYMKYYENGVKLISISLWKTDPLIAFNTIEFLLRNRQVS